VLTPNELLETFNDPSTAHAALVHAPIVLTGVGALAALLSALAMGRKKSLRWTALLICLLAAATAWSAKLSGEQAHDAMGDPPRDARALAHDHEKLAEQTTLIATGAALLAFLPFFTKKKPVASGGAWLAALTMGTGAYWAASTGRHGGTLVYTYGVGTPKPVLQRDLTPEMDVAPGDLRLVFYKQSVLPVLSDYCFKCHGSVDRPAAGLSLTTARAILAGGESGPAIVPGSADASLLYQTITGTHPDITMPPGPNKPSAEEIDAVRQWIDSGAVWAERE